jgi:hypothetical protein
MQVNIHQAKTQLSRLLELVEQDSRIIYPDRARGCPSTFA